MRQVQTDRLLSRAFSRTFRYYLGYGLSLTQVFCKSSPSRAFAPGRCLWPATTTADGQRANKNLIINRLHARTGLRGFLSQPRPVGPSPRPSCCYCRRSDQHPCSMPRSRQSSRHAVWSCTRAAKRRLAVDCCRHSPSDSSRHDPRAFTRPSSRHDRRHLKKPDHRSCSKPSRQPGSRPGELPSLRSHARQRRRLMLGPLRRTRQALKSQGGELCLAALPCVICAVCILSAAQGLQFSLGQQNDPPAAGSPVELLSTATIGLDQRTRSRRQCWR